MTQKKWKNLSAIFSLLVGVVFLGMLIHRVGYAEMAGVFRHLHWGMIWVLLFPFTWFLFQTKAWDVILARDHVSFGRLLAIKVAGEGINSLTPVSFVGGDPVRIYMLRKNTSTAASTASTILDRTMVSLAVVLFLIVGLASAFFVLELPPFWEWVLPISIVAIALLIWFFIHHQKKGFFSFLLRLGMRLGFNREKFLAWEEKVIHLDDEISRFYQSDHRRFFKVLFLHFMGRIMGVLEITLIAFLLHIPIGFADGLLLASLTILVNMVFVFIPGSMGVMEGAYGGVFYLLHLNPALGVGLQLVRRVRTIVWSFIGLVVIWMQKK